MNFFASQDRVRRSTITLVVLFALAVIALIFITNLLVMMVFGFINADQMRDGGNFLRQMDWKTFATVGVGVVVAILAGSVYKIIALSAGGKVVAIRTAEGLRRQHLVRSERIGDRSGGLSRLCGRIGLSSAAHAGVTVIPVRRGSQAAIPRAQ